MTELKDKVNALNELIKAGETIKAMEIYYSRDVEMQENNEVPRKGKTACIDTESDNLKKVKSIKSKLLNQAIDEAKNLVFSEWEILVTYKNNHKFILKQVSVQQWLNGQVLKEKFYYQKFQKIS